MVVASLCLFAGAISVLAYSTLPAPDSFPSALACALPLAVLLPLRRTAMFLAGFGIFGWAAASNLAGRLPTHLDGQDAAFTARIADFVEVNDGTAAFVAIPADRHDLPRRIRLAWFDAAALPALGETWHFEARLRQPRGNHNPGGFDFEGWLFRSGIGAAGYVLGDGRNYRVQGEVPGPVAAVRLAVVERISRTVAADPAANVLIAVTAGARHRIDDGQWDAYAATGTSHLIAISGLHVGLAAAGAWLFGWLISVPLRRRLNPRDGAVVFAVLSAFAYATLSGFAVPARRASLMIGLGAAMALARRGAAPGSILLLSAVAIFVFEPLALLEPGFLLSYTAVVVLLGIARQHRPQPDRAANRMLARFGAMLRALAAVQAALVIGLYPLTGMFFDRASLVAPIVNALVLPVFNLVVVPCALLGLALAGPLEPAGDRFLQLSHAGVGLVLRIVNTAAGSGFAGVRLAAVPAWLLALPAIYVLLPAGWPARRVAMIAIVASVSYRPPGPEPGCVRYDVLDVGQGLATVVRTNGYTMLFDTGAAYRSGGSAANGIVLPFLRSQGIDELDVLVVSHADLDHAGGIAAIADAVPVGRLLAGEALAGSPTPQRACRAGEAWWRDGIAFRVLHPRAGGPWTGNNRSCVVEVAAGEYRLLLTGDIEAPVETLLAWRGSLRRAHAVVVPHHGSRTSSSPDLVAATRPALAIVSSGYRNRWGFPKTEVVERWQLSGAELLNTATSGAISQTLCSGHEPDPPLLHRQSHRRFWHAGPPR